MEIWWLGHSCIRVKSKKCTLLADPFDDSLGVSLGGQSAEVVTISHPHPHHAHSAGILGNPRVLSGPGEYELADFYITGIGTDRGTGEDKGTINTIHSMHCEGVTLCHPGDLSQALSPRQDEELGQTDILFVPADGVCTLSTSRITEIVNTWLPGSWSRSTFGPMASRRTWSPSLPSSATWASPSQSARPTSTSPPPACPGSLASSSSSARPGDARRSPPEPGHGCRHV